MAPPAGTPPLSGSAFGDNPCVTHDKAARPLPPPSEELLNLLRRITDHDGAPKSLQADARDYLQHLEAAAFDPGPGKSEARMTGDLPNRPEVVEGPPRPQRPTG